MDYKCDFCNVSFKRNCELVRHSTSIKCKNKKNNININNKLVELENNLILYKYKYDECFNINKNLEEKIQLLIQENINLKNEIKSLEKSNESFIKIVEKAATKSTVKNNYTHNNYLNLISQEPIKFSELPKQLKEVVNCESLMYDDNEFHNHIVDNILKDENGKDKVLCTDINRKNFSYKDELSGELISDPELEKLRVQLRNGSDIKIVKRDLLNKLIEEYEDTNIDPYVKFYEILKKLEFGGQFVEHVAKKTYVKSMMSV